MSKPFRDLYFSSPIMQSHDLDSLISGLRPLFTRNEAQYPLLLGKWPDVDFFVCKAEL